MGRLIHFANVPLRLMMPKTRENITEVAFKTIPSMTKVEIRRILESMYNLRVANVETMNYEGKKKRSKYGFYRRPDFKKAYVTLKEPVTLPETLFPIDTFTEMAKQQDEKEAKATKASK
eukprot:jgi/Mesen1/8548/ME000484S07927